MNLNGLDHLERKTIYPGETFATNQEMIITTLLGSCVAACLFDPVARIFGMNHFLLSSELYQSGKNGFIPQSGRYGVQAMELLINKMMKLGAARHCIRAKAFGGATLKEFDRQPSDWDSVGNANVSFIREFLAVENIPLVAEDLGGQRGRTIYFVSADYAVYVKKHSPIDLTSIIENEKQHKKRLAQIQQTATGDISFWQLPTHQKE